MNNYLTLSLLILAFGVFWGLAYSVERWHERKLEKLEKQAGDDVRRGQPPIYLDRRDKAERNTAEWENR